MGGGSTAGQCPASDGVAQNRKAIFVEPPTHSFDAHTIYIGSVYKENTLGFKHKRSAFVEN